MAEKKLTHYLEIEEKVRKFIKKLDKNIQLRVNKVIFNLVKNPFPREGKHILDSKGNKLLCELSIDKLRFYYIIEEGRILINDVEYLGKIKINHGFTNHKSGNKNYPNQKRFILWLKKLFKKL